MAPRWQLALLLLFVSAGVCTGILIARRLATPPQTADTLFAQAKARAIAENKNVLLVFYASWCGPCRRYERFLENREMRAITEKAFVVQRIDIGERPSDLIHANTPGAEALFAEVGAQRDSGIPFIVMTGNTGRPIVSSYRNGNPDDNIGYPSAASDIDWYEQMLLRAAPTLSLEDLHATHEWLVQHGDR